MSFVKGLSEKVVRWLYPEGCNVPLRTLTYLVGYLLIFDLGVLLYRLGGAFLW